MSSEQRAIAVLVVEDNVVERLSIAASLQAGGFTVVQARDAAEALDVLGSVTPVDVVFSDVQMPGPMDGVGLAAWVAANRPEIGVILTSGRVRSSYPKLAGYRGIFIDKPYEPDLVPRKICELAGR